MCVPMALVIHCVPGEVGREGQEELGRMVLGLQSSGGALRLPGCLEKEQNPCSSLFCWAGRREPFEAEHDAKRHR